MKVILVDDEPLALEYLEHQISEISDIEIVEKFTYFEIEKYTSLLKELDLVFLDIEMPGINGLELAEKIIEINSSIAIVFVTAFDDYAVQAFELNALDYLLKPVQIERLQTTLDRVKVNKNQNEKPLSIENTLRINLCGKLSFEQTDGSIEVMKWRTTKSQELFLYLLHHAGKVVRKSKLIELLWPDFEYDRAYAQLYTAIYNTRKALTKYKNFMSIKNVQDGYVLHKKNSVIDIDEWESKIKTLSPINLQVIETYERIMDLYTGPYLGDYDYLWAEPERFRLEQLWVNIANKIADCYAENGFIERASEWYVKICELRPDDINGNLSLMKLFAELGYGLLVNHQYEQLEKTLEELDIQIDPDVKKWYEEWRHNQNISGRQSLP